MTKKPNFLKDSNDAELLTNMINLVNLTNLNEVTKSTKITRLLDEHYKQAKTAKFLGKVTITIINSILTQNRKVFLLNRDFLQNLISKDTNHYSELKFNKSNYQMVVNHLAKFICDFEKQKRGQFYVLVATVKHEGLLKLLKCDKEQQRQEVLEFISNKSTLKSNDNSQEKSTPRPSFMKRNLPQT